MKKRKIRYAVVGLGHIAQTAVLPAFKHAHKNSQLVALVSDDLTKLKKMGEKYDVKMLCNYEDYEQLLKSGLVDVVYICTPNTHHAEFAKKAAQAGVHVLCEKPLASEVKEASSIVQAAKRHEVKLMTAYRLHFDEANLEAVKIARSGRLGDLRIFNSVFTMQVRDPENIRLRKGMGGGTLFDIGIYCINAARYLFGAEPYEVFAHVASSKQSRFSEVDEMTSVVMKFPNDRLATFTCSFGASDSGKYDLIGTKGRLELDNAYDYALPMKLSVTKDEQTTHRSFKKHDQFSAELLYFSDCVLKNKKPETSGEEGLIDVQIIHALLKSIKTGKSVSLRNLSKKIHAQPKQKIVKPGLARPPKPVNATAPSG